MFFAFFMHSLFLSIFFIMNKHLFYFTISLGLAAFLSGCGDSDSDGNIVGPSKTDSSSSEAPSSSAEPEPVVAPVDYSKGVAMNKKLGKGINFGNTFDATCETCWGAGPVEKEQVDYVAKMGFQTVRLPVRWDEATSQEPPFTINPSYISRIKEVLGYFKANKMRVMMNMHHHDSFIYDLTYTDETCNSKDYNQRKNSSCSHGSASANEANLEKNLTRVDSIWAQISREFKDYDNDFLLFELFNEPVYGVTSDIYNQMIKRTHPIIRATNPGRTLVYNTHPWGGMNGIKKLELPEDGNVIIDVHYYEPQSFTHQGHNSKCDISDPVIWEDTKSNTAKITNDFANMRSMADARFPATNPEGIPITIGEFGVSTCNNVNSKALWTKNVVAAAEAQSMSWQYWAFTSVGGFELYHKREGVWEVPAVAALGVDTTGLGKIVIAPKEEPATEEPSTENSSSDDTTGESSADT